MRASPAQRHTLHPAGSPACSKLYCAHSFENAAVRTCPSPAGVCKACGSRDTASAGKLAHYQQQFAKDLDPASPGAPQTLGEMTDRLKVLRRGLHGGPGGASPWKAGLAPGALGSGHLLYALLLAGLADAPGEHD